MLINKKAIFWNLLAKKYSKMPVANQSAYQKKLDQTQQYLHKDTKIIEIGCGTGTTAIYHAPKVKKILAIDISKKMLQIAKDKAKQKNITNIDFRCSSIEDLQVEKESFDMAMAHSILHLVKDRNAILKNLHRVLKKDGILVTSTICIKDSFPFFSYIAPIGYFLNILPYIKSFNKKELVKSITSSGFEVIEQWQPGPKEATFIIAKRI